MDDLSSPEADSNSWPDDEDDNDDASVNELSPPEADSDSWPDDEDDDDVSVDELSSPEGGPPPGR